MVIFSTNEFSIYTYSAILDLAIIDGTIRGPDRSHRNEEIGGHEMECGVHL